MEIRGPCEVLNRQDAVKCSMQKGTIFRKGNSWLLGYNVKEARGGKTKWVYHVKKLAPVSPKYRTEASVRHLAAEILAPQNASRVRAEATQSVCDFISTVYLPFVKRTLKPATADVYEVLYLRLKPHLGDIEMRDFDVPTAERVLIAATSKKFAHTTHRNLRNLLSGAFRYALRIGIIRHGNPIRDVVVPKGKPTAKTPAYTIKEIQGMLAVLPEPARTVVLVAALTGLRHAEIRGLKWEDLQDGELHVRRSVWNTHIGETKTLASAAPVPVLPVLARALEVHHKTSHCEFIFAGRTNKPMVLQNMVRKVIVPTLKEAGIAWAGWHGFRRGLGSNLYDLGVPDKVIQAILRHAQLSTTMDIYVKTDTAASQTAMNKLEPAFGK